MADVTNTITRILVANRGEIARRIFRTAHEMGISTVAVFSDGDAEAPFVREADQAIALKGTTSAETYLDISKILDACKRTGADAVHPGYGFLAENAEFAQAVIAAGITWIGPSPDAIRSMGDKLSARRLMEDSGVPMLPAAELDGSADPIAAAKEIGYPVLIKASAGGGGKGMRIVESEAALKDAIEGARREAASAFGDDTVYLERWLTSSRHVEIQILGDTHGHVVHCFERECSVQRRHQKVIEEAPSSAVTPEIRGRMGAAAVAAAQSIGYASAGTVEFLLSGDEFFFLEVNTRLQVEHPVTEEITGLDLVREQIRVAQGEALGYTQDDLTITGHAIEARVYAEDPNNQFLPSPGTVVLWEPSTSASARFDSGVESGSEIGIQFDPMLAKVIVHAPTRKEAALRLARVLETTRIQGITTNRDFLVNTLRDVAFLTGDTTTDFIARIAPAPTRTVTEQELHHGCIAAAMMAQGQRRDAAKVMRSIPSGWRNTVMPPERVEYARGENTLLVTYRLQRSGAFKVKVGDFGYNVRIQNRCVDSIELDIDGCRQTFKATRSSMQWFVHSASGDLELTELPRFPLKTEQGVAGGLRAPMPGNVQSTRVAVGDTVTKGQLLLILEAMKMEHQITAPEAGTVTELHVKEGEQVGNGQLLIVVEAAE